MNLKEFGHRGGGGHVSLVLPDIRQWNNLTGKAHTPQSSFFLFLLVFGKNC